MPCLMAIAALSSAAAASASGDFYYDYSDNTLPSSYEYEDNLLSGLEWGFKLGTSGNEEKPNARRKSLYSDDSALLPTLNPRAKSTPRRELLPTRLKSKTTTTTTTSTTKAHTVSPCRALHLPFKI